MVTHQLAALLRRLRTSPAAYALAIPMTVAATGLLAVFAFTGWFRGLVATLGIVGFALVIVLVVLILTGRDQL